MRKIVFFIIGFTILSTISFSQKIEITPFGGYMFGGKVKFIQGDLKILDGPNYGLLIDVPLQKGVSVEMFWTRMESEAEWRPTYYYTPDFPETDFNVNVNYFQVGALKEADINESIKGFGSLTLGAAYFNSDREGIQTVWRFAASFGGGLKIFFSDFVGVRLQGRFLIPMYFSGVGAYYGVGGGGSSGGLTVGTTSAILQGDLTAGLIIIIGQ